MAKAKSTAQIKREIDKAIGRRIRRPTAHNPMIPRHVAKPAGHVCNRPGCGGFVRVGDECPICAAHQDLAVIDALGIGYPEDF